MCVCVTVSACESVCNAEESLDRGLFRELYDREELLFETN